ncbi:MAG: RecX family transcriptional regulator [Nitrospirae bacterium]|nr:RecX family transcriptional regulator [Nitrospirota bacterium]
MRIIVTKADAIGYAYRLLSYRGRSEKELIERLRKKGFSEEIILNTITHLKDKGFIDDAELAETLKRTAEEVKLLGTYGVRSFLRHRGIPEEIIAGLYDSGSDEDSRAKKIVEKKLRTMGNFSDQERHKKIWLFLTRKGYSSDTIRNILKRFKMEE